MKSQEQIQLFMFIQFSRPFMFDQFDKVCKKKFLDFLYDHDNDDEEAESAIKINLSRYLLRLEAQARKEIKAQNTSLLDMTDGSIYAANSIVRSSGKIIDDTIITIFMCFVMYAPVGRRDFLSNNVSIEEDFQGEAANHELLADISQSFSTENTSRNFRAEI